MKTRARATDATHSEIKNTDGEKETTIKGNRRMRYAGTRSIAMGQLPKNETGAEPIPGSPISQEEDKLKPKHKK